jgi:hypothetical protein
MRVILLTAACIGSLTVANAQFISSTPIDSNKYLHYNSSFKLTAADNNFVSQRFPAKTFILPVSMIAAGYFAAKMDPALDVNEQIRQKIWTQSPHQLQHIDNYLQFVPAVAVYGLNIAGVKGKNNFLDRSMIYIMSSMISNAAVFSLKKVTHEQRPDYSDYYSFPSGHTAQAFVSAEFLYQEYKDVSPWYGVAGYAVATGVGVLRMYNNKHWLNDVVAGAGFGIASTRLSYWLYPKIKNMFSKNKPLQTMVMPSYNNGSYGFSLVHVFR